MDLLTIPVDISFATKASGGIPDNNSFVVSDTNGFATLNSKQSSRWSRQLRSSKATEKYLFQLEQKIKTNFKVQLDNNKILSSLLCSAKISSIDEIIEPFTKISSINENRNLTTKTHTNTKLITPPIVEMYNTKQDEHNNALDVDLTKLVTVITSTVATTNPITTLRLPPFTPLDIKSLLHSIITHLTYITYFVPLLNFSQSFVSIANAHANPTVDATLCI